MSAAYLVTTVNNGFLTGIGLEVRTAQGRLDEAAHLFKVAGGFAFVTAFVRTFSSIEKLPI